MPFRTLRSLFFAGGLLASGTAMAASPAIVTNDLNIRTGPSASYQRFAVIPGGERVRVFGCLRDYGWCDISWGGERGWVHGAYLSYLGRGDYYRDPIPEIAVRVGVPVYGFDPYSYHRRYYAGRPWYRDRYLGPRRGPGFDGPPPPRGFGRDRDYDRDRDFGRDDFRREARRGPPPPPPFEDDGFGRGGGGRDFDRDDGFGRGGRGDLDRFEPRGVRRLPPPPGDDF